MKGEKTVKQPRGRRGEEWENHQGDTQGMQLGKGRDISIGPAFAELGSWDTQPSKGKRLRKGR